MYHDRDLRAQDNGQSAPDAPTDKTAIVGDIGKTSARFALTDGTGKFLESSVRNFEADKFNTVSGAIMAFREQSGLAALPSRCALAVAGVPRGDTISITDSRWFISRSGLAAMFKRPPLIINDFAANVWAVSATEQNLLQAVAAAAPSQGAGTYVVIGMGAGLGVAAFTRDEAGHVSVLSTEAGHMEFIDDSPEVGPYVAAIKKQVRHFCAEEVLSLRGLAAIRNRVAEERGQTAKLGDGEQVIRAAGQHDPDARKAVELFARALWRFAGNMTLVYGAWDGVFLTGDMVNAMRGTLRQPDTRQHFTVAGPYANMLRAVPAAFLLLNHSELRGAAEAIRAHA